MKSKTITIKNQKIGPSHPPYVIAEIGVNHNGRLNLALKMIEAAAKTGADAVKFQTFKAEQVTTAQTPMAKYQVRNLGQRQNQLAMIKKLELKESHYPKIIKYCQKKNITFLSSPHGSFNSVDLLQRLKVPAFKFGSADLTNLPVLQYAAKFNKPMIISTGMATMAEIKQAIKSIKQAGNSQIIVLHCTTDYPTPFDQANLAVIPQMIKELNTLVGYSDHTLGTQVPLMAVTLGACLIEKHFTINRNLAGPDHKASATPEELKEIVKQVKAVNTILGDGKKIPSQNEKRYLPIIRKSVVAQKDITKGEELTKDNLAIKRPGTGLAPKYFYQLLGKTAKRNIRPDTLIKLSDLK